LRRWWSLSGREGLGSSLPPIELARRDLGVFEELKRLFSTTPEVGKETEANGGHRGDWTLDRTRSLFDRTRSVSVQRLRVFWFFNRTRWRVRSQSIGRVRSIRELTGHQPDAGTVASGQFCSVSSHCFVVRCSGLTSASGPLWDQRVRSYFARPVRTTSASGRCFMSVDTVRSARLVSLTSVSGQRDFACFKFLTAIFKGVRL
jgi:hypothetical protein